MANNGFGTGGSNDFEALARQYWNSWGEMMRGAAAAASSPSGMAGFPGMAGMPGMNASANAAMPGWNEAIEWWSQLAKGGGIGAGTGTNDAIDRFNSQARGWYAQMQQVASQLAGQNASASDIAQAWKRALGGHGGNPFTDMFSSMRGPGQHGFEQWVEQAAPYLQGFERWQRDGQSLLDQPTFGFAREHQQRWQQLAQAQLDSRQHSQAYHALLSEAGQDAFVRFEQKLTERSEPGRQLESARALFDLWIDAAEEAYAEIALSPRFRDAYGAMVNSQMRLRGAMQVEIEQATELLGMPTRTEVDSVHRKIVQLERELRRMRDALGAVGGQSAADDADRAASAKLVRRPAAAVKKSVARKAAVDKAPARKATTRKAATKVATKVATKKTAGKAVARKALPPAARKPATKPAKRTRR